MRRAGILLFVATLAGCGGSKIRTAPLRIGEAPLQEIDGLTPCTTTSTAPGQLDPDAPLTVLVHGCNDSAGRFTTLSDVFDANDQQSICFTYESRDTIDLSAHRLRRALAGLEAQLPAQPITVLAHSQGGLVARHALTSMPDEAPLETQYELVTVASPFAGIRAARHCALRWLYGVSLGVTPAICAGVAGKNWYEIHRAAHLVQEPAELAPVVSSFLQVRTDERNTCRRRSEDGGCAQDDFVFGLDEQRNPKIEGPAHRARELDVGHVQVVGHDGRAPNELIELLQQEGFMHRPPPEKHAEIQQLIATLYRAEP